MVVSRQTVCRNSFQCIFPFLSLRVPDAFHHSFVHDPIPNGHLHYGCFRIFTSENGWVANGQKGPRGWWRERNASTWKDSTNLFALSATARLKGSSWRSLLKSATYPMILSSVEVIHDGERQTKYSSPITFNVFWIRE